MRNGAFGDSFRYAWAGLRYAWHTQRNFRIHLTVAGAVLVLGLWLRLGSVEWAVVTLAGGLVLVSEMLNTAAESFVDLVSPDYHPLAKVVKDVAAGAVLLAAITAVGVGLLLFGPPLWERVAAWVR